MAPPREEPPPLRNTEVPTPLPLPLPNIPVGGRLAHFAQNWAEITDDKWVFSLVRKGYRIPYQERPNLSRNPIFFQQPLSQHLEEEVSSLLSKGAVEEIIPECPGYYSRIFLVPKKNEKLRLIIDLSVLNHLLAHLSRRLSIPMVRRPSVRRPFTMLKHLLLTNRLADQSQILCGASLGRGNDILFTASGSHDQDGRHTHMWSKSFKNLLLQNRWADFHETWYVASGTPAHHSLFK